MMTVMEMVRRRTPAERRLFIEAFGQLLLVKALLLVRPFRSIATRLGSQDQATPTTPLAGESRELARRVSWAVQAVARHAPLGFVCLPQAIAAKWMLRRRGIETTLYLGLRRKDQAELTAHAWLRAGNAILTGQRESRVHQAVAMFGEASRFPPELGALLILLRAALDQGVSSTVSIENPDSLVRCIARHRVGPFLHHRLPDAIREALPESIRDSLEQQARTNALRALAQTSELLKATRRFQEAGISFVSVKGPILSQSLHGDLRTRHAGDLDLLIARDDLASAQVFLENAGYRRTRPRIPLTERQLQHYAEKEFEFRGGPHGMRVELRWLLDGIGDLAAVWPTAERTPLHGSEIPILTPTLNAIYLCQHGALHGWRRLFWLVDVALLFERDDIDWEDVLRQAKIRNIDRALLEAAALAEELLAVRRPDALRPLGEKRILERLQRNATKQIALPENRTTSTKNFLREVRHRLLLQKGIRRKWQSFRPHFHSVRNWEDLRLSDRWFWLYIPAGPLLWARRRIRYASQKRM